MKSHWWRAAFLALIAAGASCSRSDPNDPKKAADTADSQHASGRVAQTDPIPSIDEWRSDTFGDKESRSVWEQLSQIARAEITTLGADPSDIAAKASTIGRDPQKIFEFMRDQITVEPYAGVLRGARGTLVARAGNSLDRALLAKALLKESGIESRLIAGKLSNSQAEGLLARFLSDSSLPMALVDFVELPDDASLGTVAAELTTKTGLPEGSVEELLLHTRAQAEQFWAGTNAQISSQFDYLNSHLQKGLTKNFIDSAALSSRFKERLRHHFWLQLRESDGTWSDFDPTFLDARRGSAYGFAPAPVPDVPKEEFHELEFSLLYQTVTAGKSKVEVLIAGSFASADALFEPLQFRLEPVDLSEDPIALAQVTAEQKIAALRKFRRFQAVLRAGTQLAGSRIFDLDGNTYESVSRPTLGTSGGTFFGDALGGSEELPPEFVELRVVMRLTGPDRQPMSQTRTLVRAEDVLAPTFAPPLLEWDIFLQPQWISREFVVFRALNQMLALGNAFVGRTPADQMRAASELPPSDPALLQFVALLRQKAAADILARQNGLRALIDEPMLMISGNQLTGINDKIGQITGERHLDIVENSVRYVVRNDAATNAAFDAALRQGVADSAIEDRFLSEAYSGAASLSGSTIIEQAQAQKRPPRLVSAENFDELKQIGVAATTIKWIRENESPTTQLLVATTASGATAWWSIRPGGNAILRTRGGQGGTFTEYVVPLMKIGFAALCVFHGASTEMESREHGGVWSAEGATHVAVCLIATIAGAGAHGAGIALNSVRAARLGLKGVSIAILIYEALHEFGLVPP